MAFDKRTGEEVWRALEPVQEIGYPQPVIIDAGGARQLIIWHPTALVSLDPATGEVHWQEDWDTVYGMSVATPVRHGNYLLVSQFYGGSLMMKLDQDRPGASLLGFGPRKVFDRLVNWSHPAYANRHIFQRNDKEIIRASLDAADY